MRRFARLIADPLIPRVFRLSAGATIPGKATTGDGAEELAAALTRNA